MDDEDTLRILARVLESTIKELDQTRRQAEASFQSSLTNQGLAAQLLEDSNRLREALMPFAFALDRQYNGEVTVSAAECRGAMSALEQSDKLKTALGEPISSLFGRFAKEREG